MKENSIRLAGIILLFIILLGLYMFIFIKVRVERVKGNDGSYEMNVVVERK